MASSGLTRTALNAGASAPARVTMITTSAPLVSVSAGERSATLIASFRRPAREGPAGPVDPQSRDASYAPSGARRRQTFPDETGFPPQHFPRMDAPFP